MLLRERLEEKRKEYTETYRRLKDLKPKIEHLQHALETAKVKFVQDFQEWWSNDCLPNTLVREEDGLESEFKKCSVEKGKVSDLGS